MKSKKDVAIATYIGNRVNPFDPNPEDISIVDIAHSLSLQCRFNGHLESFYSVAEHCINAVMLLEMLNHPPEIRLLALLHDSAEAYISDIPAPFKNFLPEYQRVENNLLRVILDKLYPLPHGVGEGQDLLDVYDELKEVDQVLSHLEGAKLFSGKDLKPSKYIKLDEALTPEGAKTAYLNLYSSLLNEVKVHE